MMISPDVIRDKYGAVPNIRLVDVHDPQETVQTIRNLKNLFQLQDFISSYEKIKGLDKPIHIKNAQNHFHFLKLFGFIEQAKGGYDQNYKKTKAAIEICELLDSNKENAKRKIQKLLLENVKKGPLFLDFTKFVKTKKVCSIEEIKKRYASWRTVHVLIEWSVFGGIVDVDRAQKKVWYVKNNDQRKDISIKDFSERFFKMFYVMKSESAFGVEIYYADISKIRTNMCVLLGWSNDKWDKRLVNLLNSPKGKQLRLYGSTPSTFETMRTFLFDGVYYAYVGINV